MKRSLMLMTLLLGLLTGLQAESVTIGTGTSTSSGLPMNCYYGYTYSQTIYYQSEITTGMAISKIAYQYTGASWTDPDIKIFMGHTDKTVFASTTDWVPLSEMTEVFSGAISVAPGWVEITLTTPFVYNGTGNLVIAFDENDASFHAGTDDFYSTITNNIIRSLAYYNDTTNPDPATPPTGNLRAHYTNIQLISPATGPAFNITPSSNNYGLLLANTTQSQNFVVKNSGIGFLDIANGDITITGTDAASFSLGTITYPIHLAADETTTIPVLFAPTTAGEKTASLHIVDNLTKAVHDIALSGSAYQAASTPYTENFEGELFPPLYWQRLYGLLGDPSILTPSNSGWSTSNFGNAAVNGKGAKLNVWGATKSWLVTPAIDLGSTKSDLILKLDVALTGYGNTSAPNLTGVDDKFIIVISTDNGATWSIANILRQYDNAEGSSHIYNSFTPVKTTVEVDMSAYTGIAKIGFYAESTATNADNDLHIDNIVVESSSSVSEINLPSVTTLAQNYPNPFNPATAISYELQTSDYAKLSVFNAKGELVKTLVDGMQKAGMFCINFDGCGLNSGVYFYTLTTPTATITKKMLLVK